MSHNGAPMALETPPAPPPVAPRPERFSVGLPRFRFVAELALVALTLIVFTGAAVRLTGSGLGCPDWPTCEGVAIPELETHVWIEYGNRLLSAMVGIPCLLAGVLAFRLRPRRPDLVRPALLLPLGVALQGVLGGLTVLFDLHWQLVIAHYLTSLVLLTGAAILVWRARRPPGAPRPRHDVRVVRLVRALAVWGLVVIVLGTLATAAGPHAGGAGTGDVVERLDAWGAGTLKGLIKVHGHIATAMGIFAIGVWLVVRRRGSRAVRLAVTSFCVLVALQGAAGLIQYHLGLPAEVVWVHASLPALMWLSLVFAVLAAGRRASSA